MHTASGRDTEATRRCVASAFFFSQGKMSVRIIIDRTAKAQRSSLRLEKKSIYTANDEP